MGFHTSAASFTTSLPLSLQTGLGDMIVVQHILDDRIFVNSLLKIDLLLVTQLLARNVPVGRHVNVELCERFQP